MKCPKGHENTVENEVLGKKFWYCRDCKDEFNAPTTDWGNEETVPGSPWFYSTKINPGVVTSFQTIVPPADGAMTMQPDGYQYSDYVDGKFTVWEAQGGRWVKKC